MLLDIAHQLGHTVDEIVVVVDTVTIDGAATQTITANYGDLTLYFNGDDYFTIT